MRARGECTPRPVAIGLPCPAVVAREGLRALAAFGLYLVLYPVWNLVGAHELHRSIVLGMATAVILATQHFPVISSLKPLSLVYLDHLPVLILAYCLVSTRLRWGSRLRRYSGLLLGILLLHVGGVVLEAKLDTFQDLLNKEGLVLLLPWEFRILDSFKYLLVDFGLNIGPFVVMLLGTAWNTGLVISMGEASPKTLRVRRRAAIAVVAGLAAGSFACCAVRESDPRHVSTHARLGHLFYLNHQAAKAEGEYRIAIRHGSLDGEAYLNLARIEAGRGETGEARRLLQRGLEVVKDSPWRTRLDEEQRGSTLSR